MEEQTPAIQTDAATGNTVISPEHMGAIQALLDAQKANGGGVSAANDIQTQVDTVTEEDLDKAQEEQLEAKPEVQPQIEEITKEITDNQKAVEELKGDLQTKGMDFEALAVEYENNGELTAESFAALEKAGYPQAAVKTFIAGLEATQAKFSSTVKSFVGGENGYTAVSSFVTAQGEKMVDAFNATIESGNLEQINLMLQGIKAQMQLTNGSHNPRMVLGANTTTNKGGNNTFASKGDMQAAINDRRYGRDAAYTKEVEKKIIGTWG